MLNSRKYSKRCRYIFVGEAMEEALTAHSLNGCEMTQPIGNLIEVVY